MAHSSELKNLILQAIVDGIRRNGERIFNLSQATEKCYVPRVTGFLAMSGGVEPITNGVELRYRASYSEIVHDGRETAIPITGTQRIYRPTYRRKNGSVVQGHWVEYTNKKLIGFRPKIAGSKFERGEKIWRVISEEKPRKGQFFLSRAVVENIPYLPNDIEFNLKRLENR
mgnify:CR=1 FL=1